MANTNASVVRTVYWIAGTFVAITAVWAEVFALTRAMDTDPHLFGDSAGAANSRFSALAFAGVIVAIVLQMQQI